MPNLAVTNCPQCLSLAACVPGFGGIFCFQCGTAKWSAGGSASAPKAACQNCPPGRTAPSVRTTSSAGCTGGPHDDKRDRVTTTLAWTLFWCFVTYRFVVQLILDRLYVAGREPEAYTQLQRHTHSCTNDKLGPSCCLWPIHALCVRRSLSPRIWGAKLHRLCCGHVVRRGQRVYAVTGVPSLPFWQDHSCCAEHV